MKKWIYLVVLASFLIACSSGQRALEKGDYISAIEKAANRLSNDSDNKKAKRVIKEGYPLAIQYYQEEIDMTLSGNDPLKWSNTLEVMYRVNHLSEEIRRIPAARKLVDSLKIYTSELEDVKKRAAEEHYQSGMQLLERGSREDAREAYFQFRQVDDLIPSYKDVVGKIVEAKELATLNVILETIPLPSRRYQLSSEFFYEQLINRMKQSFPNAGFVSFYTPDEAEDNGLKYPDMVVRMEFYDFFIGKPLHFENVEKLSRVVERNVEVKVSRDSTRIEKRQERLSGKIKIITDEVSSQGILNVRIEEFQKQRTILNEQVPGEFIWRNQYGIFVGDEGVLTGQEIHILNNRAVPPPAPQGLFVEFTQPIFEQLTSRLTNYFKKYN
ncbi:hypothetical protein [uncultured Sunxiuqinia sp.]|uniref:hypothetical protein n=1 Tax=uncultured Sunxiuqinia sp. TaxID=1573825 RepID=UPI002AA5EAF5|nr:hypothetical protein [uncultured Sunxiuqinia sp.]